MGAAGSGSTAAYSPAPVTPPRQAKARCLAVDGSPYFHAESL
jgi:hypothetical protein